MVPDGANQQECHEKDLPRLTDGITNLSSRGTPAPFDGHSASSSGSQGSPSSQNGTAAMAPESESMFVRLNHLDILGNDAGTPQGTVIGRKKKRDAYQANGDKSERGLRQFSRKVCEKVESKGITTYNEYTGLQNLIEHNEQLFSSGIAPSGGVALPFILVQTRPHATVEVEISEDMQLVHFDFNSTPFELHDDTYVLKEMTLREKAKRQ